MNKIIIVGAGPAGIFTALELIKKGYPGDAISIYEKGSCVENRQCKKSKTGKCINCNPCHITTGFSGAGAFSDGKLSLGSEVGGDLPELIGYDTVEKIINYVDEIYLRFGADPHVEGLDYPEETKEIRKNAIKANLTLVDCPIRHLGTEKAQEVYYNIEQYLLYNGVNLYFNANVKDLAIDKNCAVGIYVNNNPVPILADKIIIATGRRGADWLEECCKKHNIAHLPGTVDIGVRVECRNEIMEKVNKALYESKLIGYPEPFRNKVRTFCQNPGGFVSEEKYDHGLSVVNGHSYKEKKSDNTNLSILCSHNFSVPFNEPIKYAKMIGELTNMLGDGHILVQRFGDILHGKRTWQKELNRSNLKPTLTDAVAGDITAAMPYRAMLSIINFIKMVDEVVPGFASDETLLYSPELKFYSNKVEMDSHLKTSVDNLYCLGDSSGWTRGLMMASVMGVYMARQILS